MNKPANKPSSGKAAVQNVSATDTTPTVVTKGKTKERQLAEFGLSPAIANSFTAQKFAHGTFGEICIPDAVAVIREKVKRVQSGDLSDIEATLTAQAVTLDAIFNEMARRAAVNMGRQLPAMETYLKHALKAQAQCRSTLETLAEIKNPRSVSFVKQANIAHGHQQVNNGEPAGESIAHGESSNQSNELLELSNGERVDSRTARSTGGGNQELEAVGTIYRPSH